MRVRAALAAGACLLALARGALAEAEGAELRARLDAALSARALRGARLAALVVSVRDGRELYARDPGRALVPASNQKILTAVAALTRFGPAHRFTTGILADAEPDASGSVDLLTVRGGGDPALTSEELWRLAADLRARGLRRVRRGLLLDDAHFDRERWHASWGKTSARAYHAPVGALTANYGAFGVFARPGAQPGEPVAVTVDPPIPFLRLVNRAVTRGAHSRVSLAVDRVAADGAEEVHVRGGAPAGGARRSYRRSVLDPARYAGALLRLQLAAVGIEVADATRVAPTPESALPLLAFEGRSLGEIVRLLMKYSNNQIGEALVKSLGADRDGEPGSWSNGIPALRAQLARAGVPLDGAILVDGSGLSYDNRVSPRTLVAALLVARRSFRFGPELMASLPIASVDGTLEDRALAAAEAVRAKTGLLTRVTALSGYARLADGETAAFSLLVNGFRSGADAAMRAVDGFAAALSGAQLDDRSGTTSSKAASTRPG